MVGDIWKQVIRATNHMTVQLSVKCERWLFVLGYPSCGELADTESSNYKDDWHDHTEEKNLLVPKCNNKSHLPKTRHREVRRVHREHMEREHMT